MVPAQTSGAAGSGQTTDRVVNLPTAAQLTEKLPRVLRRHRLMTGWMRLTGEDPVQLVRIRGDAFAYLDLSDGFNRMPVITGHDRNFFRIGDALLSDGGVYFDCGANFGLMSFGLARQHPDVTFHLFEPIPRLVEYLERTKAHYPDMRMILNACAISDFDGETAFAVAEAQTGASHIDPDGALKTPVMKLDTYVATQGIDRVAFLKLDVEGYELAALRGAAAALAAQVIDTIFFEYFEKYLTRVASPQALLDYIDSHGYEVCFCRSNDLGNSGGATHTIAAGLTGHGLPLRPIKGCVVPEMTDLLAVPKARLAPL
jgi:FkbM family methyltransferase